MKRKVAINVILPILVASNILAYTFAFVNYGFIVYETHTQAWQIDLGNIAVGIPKSFNVTVECKEVEGTFIVTYFFEISGPETLCNDYLRVKWLDTDGADFTIGRDGDQHFMGVGTITWNGSSPTVFRPAHKNNITLTLIFLTSAAVGNYKAKFWVTYTPTPITVKVTITPKTLNTKSKGEWVTAHINLPEPFQEKDIDINSVKLWYKGSYVQAEWGGVEEDYLIVKFSREKIIEILKGIKGYVELRVTGLVNDIEFYGTDVLKII